MTSFAKQVGTSEHTISRMEKGSHDSNLSLWLKAAKVRDSSITLILHFLLPLVVAKALSQRFLVGLPQLPSEDALAGPMIGLERVRTFLGWSQIALAEKSHVGRKTIMAAEKQADQGGTQSSYLTTAQQLADTMEVPVEFLFTADIPDVELAKYPRMNARPIINDDELLLDQIERRSLDLRGLNWSSLTKLTREFQTRIRDAGEVREDIIPEALAVIRAGIEKRWPETPPTREQLLGALEMLRNPPVAVEQGGSEGKTISIAMAAYVRALEGKGVHVHTSNPALAIRDGVAMGEVYSLLGLSTGVLESDQKASLRVVTDLETGIPPVKANVTEAYKADIVYGAYPQFIFDFLNDEIIRDPRLRRQPKPFPGSILVDEGDAPLFDEADNPLIVAKTTGMVDQVPYTRIYKFCRDNLRENVDYHLNPRFKSVQLTKKGQQRLDLFVKYRILTRGKARQENWREFAQEAIAARLLYRIDEDYIVKNNEIQLLDVHTGRIRRNQVFEGYLHNMIATKENLENDARVRLIPQRKILNMITPQAYYARAARESKLSVISATLSEEAEEMKRVYGMRLIVIPPGRVVQRTEHPPRIYATQEAKHEGILDRVALNHGKGNPVFIITRTIKEAEQLAGALRQSGVAPNVKLLTPKNEEEEEAIIGQAGTWGAVTVTTMMSGRGTNVRLQSSASDDGDKFPEMLVVIRTERSAVRRLGRQETNRAARREDPGETWLYTSWEDGQLGRFSPEFTTANATLPKGLPEENRDEKNVTARDVIQSLLTMAKKQKLTLLELARRTGFSTQTLWKLKDADDASIGQIYRLLVGLGFGFWAQPQRIWQAYVNAQRESEDFARQLRLENWEIGTFLESHRIPFFQMLRSNPRKRGLALGLWSDHLDKLSKLRRYLPFESLGPILQEDFKNMMKELFNWESPMPQPGQRRNTRTRRDEAA